uniref:Uncharacterized protein n=1 Tax=Panagrolaimus superbus TaxID=310955 RepID=A0A914ZD40_9BILA
MSKVVGKLNNLNYLNFNDCLCRSIGSLNIVQELVKANSSVQELLLSGNEIDAITMKKIIEMSVKLSSLNKFMLSCNSLGSMFDTLKRQHTNGIIDLGDESDDEGSASETEG